MIDTYDRCLIYYKLTNAWGETPCGVGRSRRLGERPGTMFQLPYSKSVKFHLHFFICKMAVPLHESREKNLYEKVFAKQRRL